MLRSIFLPPHYKSMGSSGSFSQRLVSRCNRKPYHGWHQSLTSWTNYLDAILAMWQPWDHVTSSKVTKMLFANNAELKRVTALCMVSLCSAHQNASNEIHFDLEVTLRSRNLRSTGGFELMRPSYTYADAYQRENLDGAGSLAPAEPTNIVWLRGYLISPNG